MRRRTLFQFFSETAHEGWFSVCLFLLRVFSGLFLFTFGLHRLESWSLASDLSVHAWFRDWFLERMSDGWLAHALPWMCLVLGVLLILGMLVRPASFLSLLIAMLMYVWFYDPSMIFNQTAIMIILFLFFLSGGVGHVIGLDYVLYHYAKEKTWITRLLVG